MSDHDSPISPKNNEGGLHAPPDLSFWRRVWWWFDFLILVNLARLRFVLILAAIGAVIVLWPTLTAHYERWTRPADHDHAAGADVEYFCPMHPSVVRDNPREKCPICFMPLSRRRKGDGTPEPLPPGIANRVQLSPYRVVLAGIKTWKVDYIPLSKEIATVGFVEFNERELKQVAARVKGRLDKLYVNETGEMVHVDDVLASLYSPDLLVTVQNLIDAKSSGNSSLMGIGRDRLKLWGISDDQIGEIEKTGKASTHLKIRSPINGHVIKKYVKEGQYVEEGMPLYDVVDLSTVWIQAQVYEDDMAFLPTYHRPLNKEEAIKIGLSVTATTRAVSGQTFVGKLTFVYPHVDPDTRSVIVRFELDNPEHKLRPGSSATVKIKVPVHKLETEIRTFNQDWAENTATGGAIQALLSPGIPSPAWNLAPHLQAAARFAALQQGAVLAVPEGAVIDTGAQQIVYREIGPSEYEGVQVELGPRMTDARDVVYYPVLRGLQAGDMVVTAGSFLVDAETRLNPAAGSIYFGGGASKSTPGGAVRPSTIDDQDARITAALAKLPSADDRRGAEAQRFCPIQQDKLLGSMGTPVKVMVANQPVFLCCRACIDDALAQPKETLEKVQKLKAKAAR